MIVLSMNERDAKDRQFSKLFLALFLALLFLPFVAVDSQ